MSLLVIPANDIDVSGLTLDVPLPVDWLTAELSDADVTAVAPGHLATRLSRSGNDVVVRGRAKASLTTPCARCLGPAPIEVDAELSLLLRPAQKAQPLSPGHGRSHAAGQNGAANKGAKVKEPEYEFTAEEAEFDTYDGETVVLDPFVREAILLEMPNFPLCSESCPGIRPAPSPGARAGGSPAPDGDGDREGGSSPLVGGAVGAEKGLDPRLAPLSALRDKLGRKSPGVPDQSAKTASNRPAKTGTAKKKKKKE